ncbi:DUF6307 family protein [Pseudonocardia halophobica]|uniref:DUF6307 family protein n=1 Tax=Pseudonocardia halophobica TaxID=29401 RepID=UPI003D8FAB7D
MTTVAIDRQLSPYERRVELVTDVLVANSPLAKEAAGELAVLVLHALDHIPERVR